MKTIRILVMLLVPVSFYGQLATITEAPALEAQGAATHMTIMSQLTESVAQSATMVDTYNSVKEGIEVYKEVSSVIKNFTAITNAINAQFDLIKLAGSVSNDISALKLKPETVKVCVNVLDKILQTNQENMEIVESLLKDDEVKTDDGSRIILITNMQDKTEDAIREIKALLRRCNSSHKRNTMYFKMYGKF